MSRLLRLLLAFVSATVFVMALVGTTRAQAPASRVPQWTKIANFPIPEEELYGTAFNNKFYVLGGFGQGGMAPGLVFEYDPAADRWTRKKDMPIKVHHQAQAAYNGKLYVFGGCLRAISGEGGTENAWEWDPVTDNWRALAPLPVKRCSAVADEVGGKIYLIGGLEPMENGQGTRVSGRNEMYDPATNTWTERSPMPTTRNHAMSGAVNGKIYVLGGRLAAGNIPVTTNIDTVEEYDPATNLWSPVKERMLQVRSGGGWAVCNGLIIVGGGEWITREFYAALRAVDAYEPATNTWVNLPSMPGATHGNAMGCINGKLYTASGKMRAGGGPDPATASAYVLQLPQRGGTQ
jgi:N-acetylneuraminic acid mutarotase